jgi:hypothetical protein
MSRQAPPLRNAMASSAHIALEPDGVDLTYPLLV